MPLTYTQRRNLYGDLTGDTSIKNLTLGDTLMDTIEKMILSMRDFSFLIDEFTITTSANQSLYNINASLKKLTNVYALNGNIKHDIKIVQSQDIWHKITSLITSTQLIPEYCRLKGRQIEFYPKPSGIITIYIQGKKKHVKLSKPDYTTGNIVSVSNGGTTITGSGTNWNSSMVGMYISIQKDNTPTSGDGKWYYISTVNSPTSLTIREPYEGATISLASQPYTIGELSLLPEDFDWLPVYKAVSIYYASIYKEPTLSKMYNELFIESLHLLLSEYSTDDTNPDLEDDDIARFDNIIVN